MPWEVGAAGDRGHFFFILKKNLKFCPQTAEKINGEFYPMEGAVRGGPSGEL
jgi:hypothetical protein